MITFDNISGLLKNTLLPEKVQVTLLSSNSFGADFDDVVEAASILHGQTIKLTDE